MSLHWNAFDAQNLFLPRFPTKNHSQVSSASGNTKKGGKSLSRVLWALSHVFIPFHFVFSPIKPIVVRRPWPWNNRVWLPVIMQIGTDKGLKGINKRKNFIRQKRNCFRMPEMWLKYQTICSLIDRSEKNSNIKHCASLASCVHYVFQCLQKFLFLICHFLLSKKIYILNVQLIAQRNTKRSFTISAFSHINHGINITTTVWAWILSIGCALSKRTSEQTSALYSCMCTVTV